MEVTHDLPALAATAFNLARAEWRRTLSLVAQQTLAAMDLKESDGWIVDFDRGVVIREVSNPEAPHAPAD